jgi:lysophospholipase L1-like esterase
VGNRDLRKEPFRRLVTLGESNTWGAWASEERYRWPDILARLINEFQTEPAELHNKGIGANVISPRCPSYQASAKPSALERYEQDVIALEPDLVVISYGLNDMRGGTPVEVFREDLTTLVREVKARTSAVVVLTSAYYQTAYDRFPPWDVGNTEAHELFNRCIEQAAEKERALFADIYEACKGAEWMIHPDSVHNNDLGMVVCAHRIFETIARHCSCLSTRAMKGSVAAADAAAKRYAEAMEKGKGK